MNSYEKQHILPWETRFIKDILKFKELFFFFLLEWVVISFSRDLPDPGIKPVSLTSPALADGLFATSITLGVKVAQLCLTLGPHGL